MSARVNEWTKRLEMWLKRKEMRKTNSNGVCSIGCWQHFFYWLRTFFLQLFSCLKHCLLIGIHKKGNNDIFTIAQFEWNGKDNIDHGSNNTNNNNKLALDGFKFHILKYWALEFPNELETGAMCARKELEIEFVKNWKAFVNCWFYLSSDECFVCVSEEIVI